VNAGDRGTSGYPLVRINSLLAIRSRLVLGAEIGPYAKSEHELSTYLWTRIPDNSLTILDKAYAAAKFFVVLQRAGSNRHWMVRAKNNMKWKVL